MSSVLNREREIWLLQLRDGKCPFEEWYKKLKDKKVRQAVFAMITRLQNPEFNNFKSVNGSVFELRIFIAAGYRLYFAFDNNTVVILLTGGGKSSQA